jgi:central kinetochore subunit Mal2/MCM21
MRVHRHTVPPCIPLEALAHEYLPTPAANSGDILKTRKQNLSKFLRLLRREIAGYHNRVAAIAGLRKSCGLDKKGRDKGKGREQIIRDISAADAEAKQVRFEWLDGRVGRAIINDKGEIKDCVVTSEEGRDRDTERKILGGKRRIEELAEKLGGQL